MRKSLMMLVTVASAAAFATMAHADETTTSAKTHAAGGGCGGYSMVVVDAQSDDAIAREQAETKAKIQALIDGALQAKETASAPQSIPKSGS